MAQRPLDQLHLNYTAANTGARWRILVCVVEPHALICPLSKRQIRHRPRELQEKFGVCGPTPGTENSGSVAKIGFKKDPIGVRSSEKNKL